MKRVAFAVSLLFASCNTSSHGKGPGGGTPDGGGASCDTCQGRCYHDHCIPDNGTCSSDNECENDSYCDCAMGGGGGSDAGACVGGICVPWGDGPRGLFDPDCKGQAFAASDFQPPRLKCHWTAKNGGNSAVIMTPLVLDLNKDGLPEILLVSNGNLVALRGADCTELWSKPTGLGNPNQIAAADFDGDGFPEIAGITAAIAGQGGFGSKVALFDHTGVQLATGDLGFVGSAPCSGPAIANVDGKGPPEILVDGTVLRWVKGNPALQILFSKPSAQAGWGNVSILADMDGDGKPEAVTGLFVYDGTTGADKTPSNLKTLGMVGAYPAVADFNGDGFPEIVNVQSAMGMQQLSVFDYHHNKVIFGPYTVAGGGWGGTPTIGDYDGDTVPDIGFASSTSYYVYALKCAGNNKPADCTGTDEGVLWQRTTHDVSSGGTGSSTFDFNGDGVEEVVYRDECWLRVYGGKNGRTIFAQVVSSGTCLEYPVIADVDGDGHADLVVPSDNLQGTTMCAGQPEGQTGQTWTQPTTGLFVFTDPLNRWMPSRALWTSHAYHITEINDDLSVPPLEPPSWKSTNTYRKNVELGMTGPGGQTDYTGGATTQSIDNGGNDCTVSERLWAAICNRGAGPAAAGVSGAFYASDPRAGAVMPLCTTSTKMTLRPGDCEAVFCDWKAAPKSPTNIWFRANDDGQKPNQRPECKNGNDVLFLPNFVCPKIG